MRQSQNVLIMSQVIQYNSTFNMTTLQIANGYLELHKQKQRHDSPTEGTFLHDSPTEGTFLQSERESILCKIRGQTVRIPNLFPMMAGWPADVNPHRETIKTVIDDILER